MVYQYILHSPLESEISAKNRWEPVLKSLSGNEGIPLKEAGCFSEKEQLEKKLMTATEKPLAMVLVIASGGTERLAQTAATRAKCPVLLVCDHQKNSLAASIEIHAEIKKHQPVKLLYIKDREKARTEFNSFFRVIHALEQVNLSRIGIIGEPSHWLLTSDGLNGFGSFQTKLEKIPIRELLENFENIKDAETKRKLESIRKTYGKISVSDKSLSDSIKAYLAIKRIIEKYRLNAITIKCFDLLEHGFTACMAMSFLNDEGLTAGCEGDLHAVFSMIAGQHLGAGPVWMANPSSIDPEENTLTLAHCTIASNMLDNLQQADLTTHMESDISTAISGPLKKQEVTVFRSGGRFEEICAIKGLIIDTNMNNQQLCRTQAVIKSESPVSKWLEQTPGNHQVLVYGDIRPLLKSFCEFTGLKYNKPG